MRLSLAAGAAVAVVAAVVGVALAVAGAGGERVRDRDSTIRAVETLGRTPPGLGRCGDLLDGTPSERRQRAAALRDSLLGAGHRVDPSISAELLAAACQTAPPAQPAWRALITFVARPAPDAHLCSALRADRRTTSRHTARALRGTRRAADLFRDDNRPRLGPVFRAIRRADRRAREAAARLRQRRARTHQGRTLDEQLRLLLVDWADAATAYHGGSPGPGAFVRRVGAAEAVDRLQAWLQSQPAVRTRSRELEREVNRPPPGAPGSCPLADIVLLD